jgi:hypothetical protein
MTTADYFVCRIRLWCHPVTKRDDRHFSGAVRIQFFRDHLGQHMHSFLYLHKKRVRLVSSLWLSFPKRKIL